jgi:hypothetical protein
MSSRWAVGLWAASVVVALGGACSSGPSFDRTGAVQRLVDAENGRLTQAQAECVVDRMADELGASRLAPDAELTPAEVQRRTAIRIDCVGVTALGTEAPTPPTLAPNDTRAGEPRAYGDDADLDALYDQCRAGRGAACDTLFDEAPLGSAYEQFAVTCGNRTRERHCADRYQ